MLVSVILILLLQNFLHSEAQKGFTIKFTNLICDPNPEWFSNVTCKINAINWKTNSIDVQGYTVKPLKKLIGHIQLFKRYSGYRPFLFNFTTDLCAFYGGAYKTPLLRAVGPIARKYSNLKKCPMEGFLYARNLKADVFDFKSIWPSGDYKINLFMYEDLFRSKIIFITLYFNASED